MTKPTKQEIDTVLFLLDPNKERPKPPAKLLAAGEGKWFHGLGRNLSSVGHAYFQNVPEVTQAVNAARIQKGQRLYQEHLQALQTHVGDLTKPKNRETLQQLEELTYLADKCSAIIGSSLELARLQRQPYREDALVKEVAEITCSGPHASEFNFNMMQQVRYISTTTLWGLLPQAVKTNLTTSPQQLHSNQNRIAFYTESFHHLPEDIAQTWVKLNPKLHIECLVASLENRDVLDPYTNGCFFGLWEITNSTQGNHRALPDLLLYGTSLETLAAHYPLLQPHLEEIYTRLEKGGREAPQGPATLKQFGAFLTQLAQTYLKGQLQGHKKSR